MTYSSSKFKVNITPQINSMGGKAKLIAGPEQPAASDF
jgi:hypothetical protein